MRPSWHLTETSRSRQWAWHGPDATTADVIGDTWKFAVAGTVIREDLHVGLGAGDSSPQIAGAIPPPLGGLIC